MDYQLIDYFSYSIWLGALIGLVRFKQLDRIYTPFILLLWTAVVNETLNSILIARGFSNAIPTNIFVLLESFLLLWFFKRLGSFTNRRWLYPTLMILFVAVWVVETLIIKSIREFSSYFIACYAFIIVLLSITRINVLLLTAEKSLIRNPQFLILIGFIIFYTYTMLVEIFWIYGLNAGEAFRLQVYRIMAWINLLVNIIFAIALLWIPRKREYSLL